MTFKPTTISRLGSVSIKSSTRRITISSASSLALLPCPRSIPSSSRAIDRFEPSGSHHSFSHSSSQSNQEKQHHQSRKNEESNDDDHLPVGVSPWARFMDVLKAEYAKSQEIQENLRELTGTAQGIKDSEAAQRMRKAYTAMRLERLIKENPKLETMAKSLTNTGRSVSDAINKVAHEIDESRLIRTARRMGQQFDERIGEPIRQTQVYKIVEETVDFSQGALRYGGYIEKEERQRRRQKRLERLTRASSNQPSPSSTPPSDPSSSSSSSSSCSSSSSSSVSSSVQLAHSSSLASEDLIPSGRSEIVENPDVPPALILHPTANLDHEQDSKDSQTIKSRLGSMTPNGLKDLWRNLQDGYEESENPVVSSIRLFTGFIKRNVFDETETARVIRLIKQVEPEFNYDRFLVDLREFIVPDFVDSFIDNDLKSLEIWTSEAAFNVTTASMKMYLQRGLRPANQIIDLKGIDIISAKVLEERDLPVFIVGFKTHEINCYINPNKVKAKARKASEGKAHDQGKEEEADSEVEVGSREEVQQVHYVLILTKDALLNPTSSESSEDPSQPSNAPPQPKLRSASGPESLDSITGGWKIIDLARRSSVAFL